MTCSIFEPPHAFRAPPRRPIRPTVLLLLLLVACSRPAEPPIGGPAGTRPDLEPPLPGPHTTGVPDGVALRRSDSIEVHRDGATISGRDVHGTIRVAADHVTIRDTRVTSDDYWPIWLEPGNVGLTVIDTEVVGSGSCQAGIGTHDYHAIRLNVHGCGDGAKAGPNTTIEFSWFHDLAVTPGSHNDGIQASDGDRIVIRGNRITAPIGQTSAIMIGPDYGTPITDVLIEHNHLDGGGYALALDAHDAVVRGNRFGGSSTRGPADVVTPPAIWHDNVRTDTGHEVVP